MENLKQKIVQYMAMENYIVKLYSINDELLSAMDEFAQMKSAVDKNDYNGICLDASIKEDEKFQEVMENLNKMKIEDK